MEHRREQARHASPRGWNRPSDGLSSMQQGLYAIVLHYFEDFMGEYNIYVICVIFSSNSCHVPTPSQTYHLFLIIVIYTCVYVYTHIYVYMNTE